MINNQSKTKEKLEPQDSEQKNIIPDKDDEKSVVNDEDLTYEQDSADFGNTAKTKEQSEQPVHPVKNPPKE